MGDKFQEALKVFTQLAERQIEKTDRELKKSLGEQREKIAQNLQNLATSHSSEIDLNTQMLIEKEHERYQREIKDLEKYKNIPHLYNRAAESAENMFVGAVQSYIDLANLGKQNIQHIANSHAGR